MGQVIIFALFVISLTLQGSVLSLAGPDGVHPDILLVIVVALSLLSDSKRGALVGLAAGLLQDILFGAPLGFFAFTKTLTGALAGLFADEIYKDFVLAPMLLVITFSVFNDGLTFFLQRLFAIPQPLSLVQYLQQYSLVRMAMHFFIMGLIYPSLYRAQKRHLLFAETEGMD
ncbi:rod shape-determining protein MreD [Dethiobacter alkaliphilus]|uniref:Rod shape-determining protein MreD n=1 Tax=Dethiobacter alkaliphilus AHT 1 TaxID=555088 RepID=C0GEW2_DETAL|nr:rod shape-determining protein MreD [Dethiobacter alkaliphilus]EEG78144.1 rod shape-determining protein MreD [Dethiobacter alkaliphilus AHT 1]